jgi:hypothetical protein
LPTYKKIGEAGKLCGMWYLNNIPKIFFGFWGTEEFPWIRYLTLETFRRYHPDWEMILYRMPVLQNYGSEYQGKSYWDKVEGLGCKIVTMDVEARLGIKFPLPYITVIADTMRYIALGDHGGFYIDLDNLFFRSVEDMPWNSPEYEDDKVFILVPPYHHIVVGEPGATYYRRVLEVQKSVLTGDPNRILDTTGCTQYVRRAKNDGVVILPLSTTEENFKAPDGPINDYALALNWHGSGTYGKYQMVTEENYMTTDHPLAACVRYCLHGDMGSANGIGNFRWIERGG